MSPDLRYLLRMTGNDRSRVFSAAAVAGRLIAAWNLRLPVSGVISAAPDAITIRGIRVPMPPSDNIAPVALMMTGRSDVVEICGLQAATVLTVGEWVTPDPRNAEATQMLKLCAEMVDAFGHDRLKLLVRALLLPPYTEIGVHAVPDMDVIERREGTTPIALGSSRGDSLRAHETPRQTARKAGKFRGDGYVH